MKIKSVSGLNGNEVLAEPILTNENIVLIPKGTVLKEEYIPLIQSLGIETLMVEDPYENLENPNTIIDRTNLERIIERVKKIMENHIYHSNKSLREFEMIANEIVKVMNEMPMNLVIDMGERTANLYEHTVMVTLLAINVARKLEVDRDNQYNIAFYLGHYPDNHILLPWFLQHLPWSYHSMLCSRHIPQFATPR